MVMFPVERRDAEAQRNTSWDGSASDARSDVPGAA